MLSYRIYTIINAAHTSSRLKPNVRADGSEQAGDLNALDDDLVSGRDNWNQMAHKQIVSIIMGIYNCQDTLAKAIDSIIAQTYADWELVMCDDGSKDRTYEIAEAYQKQYPDKIVLLQNEVNQGLSVALNKCLRAANGYLIARQDADDVSLPDRLEKQVAYMNAHTDCAFISCSIYVNDGTQRIGIRKHPTKPVAKGFRTGNQFFHQPAMFRREALESIGGYSEDPRLLRVEDYNLWTRLYAAGYFGENIQEALYEALEDRDTYKRRKFKYRINGAYARLLAVDMLNLPKWYKIFALRGIIIGLLPNPIYRWLHRKRLKAAWSATAQSEKGGGC